MGCKYGSDKEDYIFLRNAHYYGNLPTGLDTEEFKKSRDNNCNTFLTDVDLPENTHIKGICDKFIYMYYYLNNIHKERDTDNTITEEDCHFMNYWLNINLKNDNIGTALCVNDFYNKLKSKNESIFSSSRKLEKHLHVIDPGNLKNMELLYELYDTKQKIINDMYNEDITESKKKLCKEYTQQCYDKYIEGMNNCLNGYDDFYNALKDFKISYNYAVEWDPEDLKNCKSSPYFNLPNYDPVLERKEKKIMLIQSMSTTLVVLFIIPLLYKYTPLGPFLRKKINMIKNSWMNSDEYGSELSSLPTDIEDNISDNEEYNIGYYSETNY
ncbi:PIR Superfamily Protein [Plasmodium ovale wallikeri]|uniref:PIR Superfamily Protein n=1 Tax=Plasmodium ovale wallikeri TaxID=864142 RepID=A0A1A9AS19_PLAOA|nr:PIR Superfamily Protein [Plasmodium ovale wallikeri]SBT58959.1 PIR Superfamily Protein [Plasmodium ovale wallikeri]